MTTQTTASCTVGSSTRRRHAQDRRRPVGVDRQSLAWDMIAVHGLNAAIVARDNARGAALAGQAMQAMAWIRVLGTIERQQAARTPPICGDC